MPKEHKGYEYVLTMVIVECGTGSKVLEEAKKAGITGGTILLGRGTVRSPLLRALGLDETRKEIVLMITPRELEDSVHGHLAKKFRMERQNHGIIVSISVKKVFGLHDLAERNYPKGGEKMEHEIIYTIVEKGLGQQAADIALSAGSTGATIVNARGSGIHEHIKFFAMNIEPEKEIVIIIAQKSKAEAITNAIKSGMDIDAPGKGILFTMDVNRVTGLRN